jgi:hypothetical protein
MTPTMAPKPATSFKRGCQSRLQATTKLAINRLATKTPTP